MSSTGSDLEMSDQSMGNESDTSGALTAQTSPELPLLSDRPEESSHGPKPSIRDRVCPDIIPDFSDDPDDDTDEDIANVPLDYRYSDQTMVRRVQIKQYWHKYYRVKARGSDILLK
ncbi:hypothetical protein N7481_004900 [Penicillium waksmanii]|uniref:uncharacterized protein n=1 Tax=Penicillium waksmanii TaxID=69791 RepID=UPI002546664B|nr:uncharacterized protein N7481_004900 [Penicillium waksmanii]KAJ5989690.1 hypothetical protein N7481_004900 [Penicillium waksmanii]